MKGLELLAYHYNKVTCDHSQYAYVRSWLAYAPLMRAKIPKRDNIAQ
jgi:hypothetical protein